MKAAADTAADTATKAATEATEAVKAAADTAADTATKAATEATKPSRQPRIRRRNSSGGTSPATEELARLLSPLRVSSSFSEAPLPWGDLG